MHAALLVIFPLSQTANQVGFLGTCRREEFCLGVEEKRPPSSLCLSGAIATSLISTLTPLSSAAAREDPPFWRPSSPTDLEVCRESTWFRQARRLLQPASGRLVRFVRLCTPRLHVVCQAYDGSLCSDFSGHHCLLPPHGVEDCTVFFFFFFHCVWLHSRPSLRSFPSSWLGTALFLLLSFDATRKPLTRWRLALAQEAVRRTFLRPPFSLTTMSVSEFRRLTKNFHSRDTDSGGPECS